MAVTVRPDKISERWAGIFLMHELTHGLEKIYLADTNPDGSEYMAYLIEMESYDLLTKRKFSEVLTKQLKNASIRTHDDMVKLCNSDISEVHNFLYGIDAELNEVKPESASEEEMRIGFYLMAATIKIGQDNNYSFEQRIKNLNDILKKTSIY